MTLLLSVNFHILVYLIIGWVAVIFGLVVYLRDRKNIVYKTFLLLNIALGGWAFSCVVWLFQSDPQVALFLTRIFCLFATFIPVFLLHWILAFLKKDKEKSLVLKICYFITFVLVLFSFSSLYVKGVKPMFNFPFWPQAGPLYLVYLILGYFGMWFYALYQLILAHHKNVGHRQMQIRYVVLGLLVGVGGGTTNFFLMLGFSWIPALNFSILAYPLIFTYAMMRHRLMDIRVFLTEFLVFLIGAVLLVEVILAESWEALVYRSAILLVYGFFGYLLTKSVLQEIKSRERLQELTLKLRKAYKELERLDKAKSEFISIASHQLRTPLTAIKGYISMILEGTYGQMTERIKKPMENVYKSNERLIKLINDLLNVSRIESGRMEMNFQRMSPLELITSCVEELKIQAQNKNIELKWEEPEEALPQISIDQDKIRQVILNIIDNAIKYTERGKVWVKCQIIDGKYRILVSDTGAGMTTKEISYLFESFSRGKAGTELCAEGAGLGLYVARKFVEMHGGKIWAESPGKDKGSTFYIELPIK